MNALGRVRDLMAVADAVLQRRQLREPMLALAQGLAVSTVGSVAAESADEDAAFFAQALRQLDAIDAAPLDPDLGSFRDALAVDLRLRVEAHAFHGLDFVITPYRGGDLHVEARRALREHPLDDAAQCDAYRALVRDYGRLLGEVLGKTRDQARRGIRLAAAAVPMARDNARDLLDHLRPAVIPDAARLRHLAGDASAALERDLDHLIADGLAPPLRELVALLDDDYIARAPQGVGLGQYPGGDEYYGFLVRQRADSSMSPAAIHSVGLEEVADLQALRQGLRHQLAPDMLAEAFDRFVQDDARWHAATPADVEACFVGHLTRLEPMLPQWFGRLPRAGWAVTRADPAVERGMSFGYYQQPTPTDPVGRYRYNGTGLDRRSLIGAAHLIFHELMPGHHLQLSLRQEQADVHPLQTQLYSMASVEGWAVYASELAREMGLLQGFDLYGHAVMQSWLAARLVVDTGLNALGWTLRQAAEYMRSHTLESAELIDKELLRYATDIPAQALAYDLGRIEITRLRERARSTQGASFDIRAFHDGLLSVGGYPLSVIDRRIDPRSRP